MNTELQELIRNARKELRKAFGGALTPEEEEADQRKAALEKLESFALRKMGVRLTMLLNVRAVWTDQGPAVNLEAEDRVFHMRNTNGNGYALFIVDRDTEREIATIEASDPIFSSRVLVAIDDAVSKE